MSDEFSFTFSPNPGGVPVELWAAMCMALNKTAQKKGYDLYCKQEFGLGRIYVRRASERSDVSGADGAEDGR